MRRPDVGWPPLWLPRQQDAFIECLKAENRMLKAHLGRRRIIFSHAERLRSAEDLVVLAKPVLGGRHHEYSLAPAVV